MSNTKMEIVMRKFATAGLLTVMLAGSASADATTVSTTAVTAPAGDVVFLPTVPGDGSSVAIFYNSVVYNVAGDNIGDINDLLLGPDGRVTTAIIGVGGFLGIGEKNVAIAFDQVKVVRRDGTWLLVVNTTKEALNAAPAFEWSGKRVMLVPKLYTTTTEDNDAPVTTSRSTTLPAPQPIQ
jgi:sporulation protein YlmC with PRC-barrel domain